MSTSEATNNTSLSNRQRLILLIHGFITITLGFFGGFAWLISLAGFLELWPFPAMDLSVPDTKELWRNAHTGPINNGMLVILLVAISPLLMLKPRASQILTYAAIAMLWGNTIGYSTGPFSTNRGLTPTGDFINILCYGSFYVAVVGAFILVGLSIYGCYRSLSVTK